MQVEETTVDFTKYMDDIKKQEQVRKASADLKAVEDIIKNLNDGMWQKLIKQLEDAS